MKDENKAKMIIQEITPLLNLLTVYILQDRTEEALAILKALKEIVAQCN